MTINPITVILKQAGLSSEEVKAIEKFITLQAKDEEWLTPDRLFERFDISKSTQAKLRMNRKIPFSKIGKYIRYSRTEINKWLQDHNVEAE